MDIDSFKRACVIGWERSGISLCNLLLSLKKEVRVSEIRERSCFAPSLIDEFRRQGVEFEFGGHSQDFIKDSQLVIVSPGVDMTASPLAEIIKVYALPCVGELEFSSWLTKAKCIAITGTNGKTTTSYLTYKVFQEKRKRVFLGGNIGTPLSSFVLNTKDKDLIILEVSSFQLETIFKFRPFVAAFLNIEPDHLDRYPDFGEYLKAKMNIFRNQRPSEWAVLNKEENFISSLKKQIRAKIIYFSDEFANENLSCVYRIAGIFGLSKTDCLKVFSSFTGLPHRLQLVRKVNNITFVNDSKATNPASTIWALKNTRSPLILIAGGKDKGLDFSAISPYLRRVKKLNLFGESAPKIKEVLDSQIKSEIFPSLRSLVVSSFQEARPGDTILFSPMCASFDLFSNYEERGDKFIEIVNDL